MLYNIGQDEIYLFLDYLTTSNKFKYILLVNCCNQKAKIKIVPLVILED